MSTCKNCGGKMIGDGLHTVPHCEHLDDVVFDIEPDANPVYCENEPEERKHHPYSPSTLQSLEACPCYIGKQSAVVHERTTAGTRAHGVVESGEDDNRLSDEDAAAAAECLDFVEHHRQLFEEARARAVAARTTELWGMDLGPGQETYDAQKFSEKEIPQVLEVKEAYLPVDDLEFRDWVPVLGPAVGKYVDTKSTTAGYMDNSLIDHTGTHAKLFDWKFGNWPVEQADNNLQGIAYVLGLAKKYPKLNRFEFFFKQPHLNHISHAEWTREQLPALYLRVQVVVARARAARASILKGDWNAARPFVPACNFCGNIGRCPVVSAFICKVGNKFHPLAIPADITPSALHSSRDTVLGLQLASVVTVWAKAYKTQVTDRIIRGDADIPPDHILQTKQDREIADPVKYRDIALRYITEQQLQDASTIGFGKVEDAIKDKTPRGAKKAAIETFNKELLDSGAVRKEQPYTFLKAKPEKTETKTNEKNTDTN
jgi:hypothetical protein